MTWWMILIIIYLVIGLIVAIAAIFSDPIILYAGVFLIIVIPLMAIVWPYTLWGFFFDPMRNVGRWI